MKDKRQKRNSTLGTRASMEIFACLLNSTFAEKHPEAYKELRHYEDDLAKTVEKVLNRSRL